MRTSYFCKCLPMFCLSKSNFLLLRINISSEVYSNAKSRICIKIRKGESAIELSGTYKLTSYNSSLSASWFFSAVACEKVFKTHFH